MGLPNVNITILNGQLGRVAGTADGVAGLILTGVAVTGKIALSEPKQVFGTDEVKALGIDEAYDTANNTDAYAQIKDFYSQAGEGAELWIMLISDATTMAMACDKSNDIARKLLDIAEGAIKLLGITRAPAAGYIASYTDGIDDDANAAVLNLHALAEEYAAGYMPFRGIVGGRDFQGVPANLLNFRQNTNNRVGVTLEGLGEGSKSAAVGRVLGKMAKNTVQRNIARVKDGDLGLVKAYLSNGEPVEKYKSAWDSIHDKGYIFTRKFPGKNGYFYNDDPACCPLTDDYSSLARGRVIDKATVIAYTTYVEEIQDDLEVDEEGYINPATVKDYQQKIENAIGLLMVPAEASAVTCEIDPKQNLLATDTVKIKKLSIRPRGYAKFIDVPLGFENPLNSN
jgi:hypothetical protein